MLSTKSWQTKSLTLNHTTELSKLKALADDKIKEAEMVQVSFDRVENIVRKRENGGNQHFLLFRRCFLPFETLIPSLKSHIFCRLQMP